jgi:hypothetical protein
MDGDPAQRGRLGRLARLARLVQPGRLHALFKRPQGPSVVWWGRMRWG